METRFTDIIRSPRARGIAIDIARGVGIAAAMGGVATYTLLSGPKPTSEVILKPTPRPTAGQADVDRGNAKAVILARANTSGCDTVFASIKGNHFENTDTVTTQYHPSRSGYVVIKRMGNKLVQTFFAATEGSQPVRATCATDVTYLEITGSKDRNQYIATQELTGITAVSAVDISTSNDPMSNDLATAEVLRNDLSDPLLNGLPSDPLVISNQGTELHPSISEQFTKTQAAEVDKYVAFAHSVIGNAQPVG